MDQKKTEKLMETEVKIILDSIQSGIVIIDAETHRIIEVNPIAVKMIGAPEEKIIGAICHKYICLAEKGQCPITDLGQKVDNSERVLLRANGDKVSILKTVTTIVLRGRKCLLENFIDITERKQAEEALREDRERYNQLVNSITDVFFAFDKDLKYTYWNAASEKLTKISAEDAIGKSLYDLFPNTPQTRLAEKEYREVLRTGLPQVFVNEYKIGGKDYYFEISAYPSRDGISVFTRDITERKKMETLVKASEEKYHSLVQNIPDVVWTTDINGRTVFISSNVKRIYGYTSEEIIEGGDKVWFGRIHPDDIERVKKTLTALFEKEDLFDIEYRIKRKNGEWIWLHDRATTSYEKNGIKYADGVFSDITERKKTEELQGRLSAIIEATPDFVGFADAKDKHIIYINKAGRKMIGVNEDEDVTKLKIFDVHPEWTNKMFAEEILPAAVRDGTWTGECAFLNIRDRHEIPVLMVLSSHKAPNGEVEVFSTISRDITERKKMEEELLAEKNKLVSLIEGMPIGVYIADPVGKIIMMNKAAEQQTGYKRSEMLGNMPTMFAPKRELPKYIATIEKVTKKGFVKNVELIAKRKDGTEFFTLNDTTLLKDANGKIISTISIIRDITERKELEEQRLESNKRLQRLAQKLTIARDELKVAIETKGEFMNIAAHELRTPLQPIIGYADRLLQENNPTDWQKERLNIILDNAKRLLKLVQDLLDINKMETGIMKFSMEEVDLLAIIKEIYQSFKPAVEAKKLKFILDISETPGPIKIEGDPNRLNQVFSNLLDNAIKFTDKGAITIQVREGKNTATVSFKDTGNGIAEKYMPRLFTKFFQANGTDKRKVGGTGLGLTICKEIVKVHKGKIGVQSTLGKGSTFQVILPKLTRPTKRKGVENGQNFGSRR
ncbi:MAG: PAS domain S-box protein [Candidatus Marinimicrobia bacterium]|nr:PAS domain S-box protein [Candidatus Neomarinimicrobiota bacterium]